MGLQAKEGLGLINGTQFILAHTIVGLHKMEYLLDMADVAGAISIEGYQGSFSPFKDELHKIRPFKNHLLDTSINLNPPSSIGLLASLGSIVFMLILDL